MAFWTEKSSFFLFLSETEQKNRVSLEFLKASVLKRNLEFYLELIKHFYYNN